LRRSAQKILNDVDDLRQRSEQMPRPLVFTNGCFDLIHRGHVDYLEQARAFGRCLLVAVNSDDSVRRLDKGTGRPINNLEDRMAVLAALESVDFVTSFEDDTPLELIKLVRPDVLVKGGDWAGDRIVGASEVRAHGGTVHSVPIRYTRSTSDLIRRIRA